MSTRFTGKRTIYSYAREDREFVRVLHAFLVERGRDAWVDWRDIAAAAPWADEIARGIEAAEALVFVASPDSVASPACLRELDHAVSVGKKLVPLVRREVDTEAMPAPLRPLHWVFARDEREQREALEAVVDALEVDLEWARRHARILVRALEWHDRGRSTSLLLRGTDLETAERGIAEAAGSVPKPVFLQLDYLQESRLEADRSDERQADLQAKHASELAGRDPEQALLVAAAAIREYRPSPSAVETAETLLRENHARLPLPPDRLVCLLAAHTAKVLAVAWAPDGRQVATAAADGEIILWDPQSATPIARVATGGSPVSTLVYGPRGPYLLAWGWYSAAAIIETRNGEVVAILDTEGSGGADAAWVAGRAALALPHKGKEIRVWDVEETTVAATLDAGTVRVTTLAASDDGRRLAAAGSSGDLLFWDIETGERRSLPTGQEDVSCMAFAPNGSDLVVGSFFGGLEMIHTATASPPTTLAQSGGISIGSVSFSPAATACSSPWPTA